MESNQIIVFFSSHMPSFGLNSNFFYFADKGENDKRKSH